MATEESISISSSSTPTPNDDDIYHPDGDDELDIMAATPQHLMSVVDDEDEDELHDVGRGMSLLSLSSPADPTDDDNVDGSGVRRVSRPIRIRGECHGATDPRRVNRQRKAMSCRERFLNRAWERRRCKAGDTRRQGFGSPEGEPERLECRLMVRPHGREEGIPMDMEEVKACHDLGLPLPRDWTVEISGAGETSSGGSSPMSDWCISSPGDSPRDVKARLKVWAQAVALASTTSLSNH